MSFRHRIHVALAALAAAASCAPALACEDSVAIGLDHVEVTTAERVPAGAFVPPAGARRGTDYSMLPAFCRITAIARPVAGSTIGIEIWLPAAGWNGRLLAVGNGGWAGSISHAALAAALADGYAATSTDTGHTDADADFALGRPEKLIDFGHRAVEQMALTARAVVRAYYGEPVRQAYFSGCSTGGRQALATAQRYPDAFDGIIAGAPANWPTHLQAAQLWTARVAHAEPDAMLDPAALGLLNDAVVAACDTLDGVADGVLEDPDACRFDPHTLVCGSSNGQACLTAAQARTAARIYQGPRDAAGRRLFPGLARGSERGWEGRLGPVPPALATDTFRILVRQNPDWSYEGFDLAVDVPLAVERIGQVMDANDPDIAAFLNRGGKLLLYHGWNDPGIAPGNTIDYYQRVVATVDAPLVRDGLRLFMVPGMNHCRGGIGTDDFDAVAALDRWVRAGEAPQRLVAARRVDGRSVRTRPLCPYPQTAVYDGSGDTDAAGNFRCGIR